MKLLVVDRGNTRTKIAAFNGKKILCVKTFDSLDQQDIINFTQAHPCSAAIVSSSGDDTHDVESWLEKCSIQRIVRFDHETPTPLKNRYKTPSTLGIDRLATAIGAAEALPHTDLLIFDFGTAITVDYVSAQGEFFGGNISPGLAMRFAALHRFTKRLPLVESGVWAKCSRTFGLTTHEAIYRGVVNGICHEIEGYIAENLEKTIFFTGGDAIFFEKQIKKAIFADQLATLRGLRAILETICSNE